MSETPTHAWVIYEDIYGRNSGPYVCAKDFFTQEEAETYKAKAANPCHVVKLRFKANKNLYPEYYNEIDHRRDG